MHIVVGLKQVLDPEIPARDFRIDRDRREAVPGSAALVTNIFCENALELALQVAEREPGTTITAVSVGPASVEDTLRKALALKATRAVHVRVDGIVHTAPADMARMLAAAIRKVDAADLVMLGRESADWGFGQTGALVAEELALPFVGFVDRVERPDGGGPALLLRRQTDTGWERLAATPPVVVTVTNDERNVPRIPKTRDVMMSYRQAITTWTPADLGLSPPTSASQAAVEVVDLSIPARDVQCEMMTGKTLDEKVDGFARRVLEIVRAGS
jgi:electron transfer flavoprotein beta subunit